MYDLERLDLNIVSFAPKIIDSVGLLFGDAMAPVWRASKTMGLSSMIEGNANSAPPVSGKN